MSKSLKTNKIDISVRPSEIASKHQSTPGQNRSRE